MSQAKRDHSAFNHPAAIGRAVVRSKPTGHDPWLSPAFGELQVLESWVKSPAATGDPYNGIGARVVTCSGPRR